MIIQYLAALVVDDAVNSLSIYDQFLLDDKIRNVLSDQFALVQHLMPFLLIVRNITQAELHADAILINFFVKPVAANVSMAHTTTAYTSFCNNNSCLLAFIRG